MARHDGCASPRSSTGNCRPKARRGTEVRTDGARYGIPTVDGSHLMPPTSHDARQVDCLGRRLLSSRDRALLVIASGEGPEQGIVDGISDASPVSGAKTSLMRSARHSSASAADGRLGHHDGQRALGVVDPAVAGPGERLLGGDWDYPQQLGLL